MRILCLCPTYRRRRLLSNLIACFEAQGYAEKFLLVLDDSGDVISAHGPQWQVVGVAERLPTLTAKYNHMLAMAAVFGREFDAVALMDDDDVYGPRYLSSHAFALERAMWSYPHAVWSTHAPPAVNDVQPGLESSGGRFWASAAVRADLLMKVPDFLEIPRPTFDQEHLALWLQLGGEPGRPDDFQVPQYVYGWGRAPRHVSLEMPDRKHWYANYATHLSTVPASPFLAPQMDEQTRAIYAHCWKSFPGNPDGA